MRARQDFEITVLMVEALARELSPEMRAILARRQDVGALAERLQAIGGTIGISYLSRVLDLEGLADALRVPTAPLVLLGDGDDAVLIGLAQRGGDASVIRVTATGARQPIPGDFRAQMEAIVTVVGRSPRALSPLALVSIPDPLRSTLDAIIETGAPSPGPRPARERNVFSRVA